MRIAVFSDLHGGAEAPMKEAFDDFDHVVFLGDGLMKIRHFEYEYPEKFLFVRGNCDGYDETAPLRMILDFDGVKVMMTHGHEERVKCGTQFLLAEEHHSCDDNPCQTEAVKEYRRRVHAQRVEVEGTKRIGAVANCGTNRTGNAYKFFTNQNFLSKNQSGWSPSQAFFTIDPSARMVNDADSRALEWCPS